MRCILHRVQSRVDDDNTDGLTVRRRNKLVTLSPCMHGNTNALSLELNIRDTAALTLPPPSSSPQVRGLTYRNPSCRHHSSRTRN